MREDLPHTPNFDFELPEFDFTPANDALNQLADNVANNRPAPVEQNVEMLKLIQNTFAEGAKKVALDAVSEGIMTRRRAGELIGKNEHTISRWLTERAVETPEEP